MPFVQIRCSRGHAWSVDEDAMLDAAIEESEGAKVVATSCPVCGVRVPIEGGPARPGQDASDQLGAEILNPGFDDD